ncbi:DUF4856 domain-containing protein [Shewanella intestini]|uniref:DUF4856 domain-containing protein n=1 Tax=Shewanella intestini TaxID=2017544 RepID=A0ABS5I585_9GAMM|nr:MULTISPECIES: DUF4856 domain-containing protein [Shewanella]MBR9729187.1 DUF4856 domain-containing protein [Shewanella intestini]MRG37242.1 DUF4856 domain-containing protein [Shewanella sp. XMDDZSB0408]
MQLKKTVLASTIALSLGLLTACGGSDSSDAADVADPVTPVNSAPTDIMLSNASVDENMYGAIVGELSVTDTDSADTHTYSVEGDVFAVDGTQLMLAEDVMLDADTTENLELTATVTVTDNSGESFTKDLTVTLMDVMDRYEFDSMLNTGESSVSYTGQTARHILIEELNQYIKSQLVTDIDNNTLTTKDEVLAKLNYFYLPDETTQYDDLPITFVADSKDGLLSEITGYKNLHDKVAGNDASGQHEDWNNGAFAGWGAKGSTTPTMLIETLFDRLADNAVERINGQVRQDVLGNDISKVYIDENGVDLAQLIQKFLLMSITYSQASDDYFGDDTDGKGLTTDNISAAKDGAAYTNLEHQFDEGFGYFGAARNYLEYADIEIAGGVSADAGREDWNGWHDTDGDGKVDLHAEYNFGQSVNAAKRDLGTADNAMPTDYTMQAMEAFIAGRKVINDNVGAALTADQKTDLKMYAETGVKAWELAIVATVVHYINDVNADLAPLATGGNAADFNYENLAKHYSEMKGFGLGLQFSEYGVISDADFEMLHQYFADEPVLTGDVDAYIADLITARDLLQTTYGLNAENVENW